MSTSSLALAQLNGCSQEEFIRLIGPIYEHSPWIADKTWSRGPFSSLDDLKNKLEATLQDSTLQEQLGLIRAHPDLAGRLAQAGQLTLESKVEQHSAGLDDLSTEEAAEFDRLNGLYVSRFGFPFVICARLNDRKTILAAFQRRLHHEPDQEIRAALEEIRQIAALRLAQIVHD